MRFALKFAYDGRNYYGYVRQPKLRTVESDILNFFKKKRFLIDIHRANYKVASRTDKGVSALGNVLAFDTDITFDTISNELRDFSDDIFFYGHCMVDSSFYPRHAKIRIYRYYLKKDDFKINDLINVLSCFTGEHNFSNFARVEEFKDPIRVIDNILVSDDSDFFIIDFYAQTYLWHQIRRIISAVNKVLNSKIGIEDIKYAFDNPDEKFDYGISPPQPLILKDIVYDINFDYVRSYEKKLGDLEKRIVNDLY